MISSKPSSSFILFHDTKFYPEADNWHWTENCKYLGSVSVTHDGITNNYDLGIWMSDEFGNSASIVDSNEYGNYQSYPLYNSKGNLEKHALYYYKSNALNGLSRTLYDLARDNGFFDDMNCILTKDNFENFYLWNSLEDGKLEQFEGKNVKLYHYNADPCIKSLKIYRTKRSFIPYVYDGEDDDFNVGDLQFIEILG